MDSALGTSVEECWSEMLSEGENHNDFLPPLDCLTLVFRCLERDDDGDLNCLALALTCKDMYAAFGVARGDTDSVSRHNPRAIKIKRHHQGQAVPIVWNLGTWDIDFGHKILGICLALDMSGPVK